MGTVENATEARFHPLLRAAGSWRQVVNLRPILNRPEDLLPAMIEAGGTGAQAGMLDNGMDVMPRAILFAVLLCALPGLAQSTRPQFNADRVIPSFADTPLTLAPAMLVSIYGENLGPEKGCLGTADPEHWETLALDNPFGVMGRIVIYPTLLCGVQVKIGDVFAGLLWTQNKQINFQVPKDVPFAGSAELRVIKDGVASDPVRLEFGLERIKLTQDEPAYVDMPVWVRVHTSRDIESPFQYPMHSDPLRTVCEVLEVRRNGLLLPKITPVNPIRIHIGAGNICADISLPAQPSKVGRLPFHLLYRFDQPGQYQVRFTQLGGDASTIRERSAWTTIEVQPADPYRRAEWLRVMEETAPDAPAELLSDFLPSLLGYGHADALPLLLGYLYHSDDSVRRFVTNGLTSYYHKAVLVPALQAALLRQGPSETVSGLLEFLISY